MILLLLMMNALLTSQTSRPSSTVLLISLDAASNEATNNFRVAFPLTSVEDGVRFDLDCDGVREQVAWTWPRVGVAFLAIDRNGNGQIDNGSELVGNRTVPGARNGISALVRLNVALKGRERIASINADEPLYSQLLLWHDANHNGISETTELQSVSNIASDIGLGYTFIDDPPDGQGNEFRYRGWIRLRTAWAGNLADAQGPVGRGSRTSDAENASRRIYEVALSSWK